MVQLDAELKSLLARRDAGVLAEQQRHQPQIDSLTERLSAWQAELEAWAGKNRAKEFGDQQSLVLTQGRLFFQKGQRALEFLSRWDAKKALKAMAGKAWSRYVRRSPSINKAKLLADTAGDDPKLEGSKLADIGLKVVQEERFHVELNSTAPAGPTLEVERPVSRHD